MSTQADWVGAVVPSELDPTVWVGIVAGEAGQAHALAARSQRKVKDAVTKRAARDWGVEESAIEWSRVEEGGWDAYVDLLEAGL